MGLKANEAGIDFQNRVCACFMAYMLLGKRTDDLLSAAGDHVITEICCQANEPTDDIVIKMKNGSKICSQVKRTIDFSVKPVSEFYSVCKQFVEQYIKEDHDITAYTLITGYNASRHIRETTRRLLDSIRTSNSLSIIDTMNKAEKSTYKNLTEIVEAIYMDRTHKKLEEDQLLIFLKKVYVEILDVEKNQGHEKAIKTLLSAQNYADAEQVWSHFITMAMDLSANRRTVTKESLEIECEKHLSKAEEKTFPVLKHRFDLVIDEDNKLVGSDTELMLLYLELEEKEELSIDDLQVDFKGKEEYEKAVDLLEKKAVVTGLEKSEMAALVQFRKRIKRINCDIERIKRNVVFFCSNEVLRSISYTVGKLECFRRICVIKCITEIARKSRTLQIYIDNHQYYLCHVPDELFAAVDELTMDLMCFPGENDVGRLSEEIIYQYVLPEYIFHITEYMEKQGTELIEIEKNPWLWYVGYY